MGGQAVSFTDSKRFALIESADVDKAPYVGGLFTYEQARQLQTEGQFIFELVPVTNMALPWICQDCKQCRHTPAGKGWPTGWKSFVDPDSPFVLVCQRCAEIRNGERQCDGGQWCRCPKPTPCPQKEATHRG